MQKGDTDIPGSEDWTPDSEIGPPDSEIEMGPVGRILTSANGKNFFAST